MTNQHDYRNHLGALLLEATDVLTRIRDEIDGVTSLDEVQLQDAMTMITGVVARAARRGLARCQPTPQHLRIAHADDGPDMKGCHVPSGWTPEQGGVG